MTFSIVAKCERTGQFGISAATALPAVGKLLTHAHPGAGAVATQALLNPYLGIDGITFLRQGLRADEVVKRLRPTDPRMNRRQFAIIDATGQTAVWTGEDCLPWAGSLPGDGFSIQGNRLPGPQVLEAAAECMEKMRDEPLERRLVEALHHADKAGGDKKGERSATVYIVDSEEYPLWDIRVDDHPRPVEELYRLLDVFQHELVPEIRKMPTRANPAGKAGERHA